MSAVQKTWVLLTVVSVMGSLFGCAAELIPEDCGDVQYDVENGMIRLPDFSGESIRDLNCSWTYTAPAGRKLLVKVDSVHLPPLDLRTSQFQLYIDDTFYDIPRNCVKCLREMVGGKVLNVIFTSYVVSLSESHVLNASEISSGAEGIGSFQVRYKAFDPHRCGKPEQIENGYMINKGRKVGQSIFYHCNPPYDLIGDSELQCVIPSESPVPEWSNKAPKCVVQDCTGEAILKKGTSGAIASPGYPHYIYQFTSPCIWEINAQPNHQIKVSVTYLKFPKTLDNSFTENISRLSLIDGDYNNYIVNITESMTNGPFNFTTLTNKLTVEFIVNEDPKKKEESGVYINYSFVSSSCPKPRAPDNGEVVAFSTDLGSTVAYRCQEGFVLVGELHAECLFNGQWSHPTPSCELLSVIPSFLFALNDSDTVTVKVAENPVSSDVAKYNKNGKKKAFEIIKDEHNVTAEKEKFIVPKDNQTDESSSMTPNIVTTYVLSTSTTPATSTTGAISKLPVIKQQKNMDKESGTGPKSEPHLFQVVPPKENGKKVTEEDDVIIIEDQGSTKYRNVSGQQEQEQLPTLDTGYKREFDIGGFKLSFTVIYIIAGVGIPLILIIIILIVIVIYRRRYPVRMRFGRKFSTFENPMYVTKDAQHPRELKRLTN